MWKEKTFDSNFVMEIKGKGDGQMAEILPPEALAFVEKLVHQFEPTRQKLLDDVWGYSYFGDTRTLDVHIRRLRQKLGDCGSCIETVVGVGYRFIGAK